MASRFLWLGPFLAAALVLCLAPVSAQGPIFAIVTGPSAAGVGQVSIYNVSINGGPTNSVNYTIQWYITGSDLTGGLPLPSAPSSTTGTSRTFKVNLTAPMQEQTITLVVKISSHSGETFENTSVEQPIAVVTPVILSATFRNDGSTTATNVTVRFFVDGNAVGTTMIAKIKAGQQATASFSYLPVGLQPGTHTVRIEADLDGNGVIDPARGEAFVSQLFYKGTPGLGTGWTVLIGIAVFVPVFFVTVALRRRGRP